MDELPELEGIVRKNMQSRVRLLLLISVTIFTILMLEELFDLPYLIFGSLPTPINYHEMMVEGTLILVLILSMFKFYHSELNKHLACNREMHERMERECLMSHKLEIEKEISSRLLALGYKYHHECQTPLVTLGGYFESMNEIMCEIIDCPVIEDRDVIINNIQKLYIINKCMAQELNALSNSLDIPIVEHDEKHEVFSAC